MKKSSDRHWSLESRESLHEGFYRIDLVTFRHSLHRGGDSGPVQRELFTRGDVVGLLPYDPVLDQVLLVEQFRIGAMHEADGPWLWEIVAGMIDTEESPEAVARREAEEEAGLVVKELTPICRYLASPGASTEQVILFLGECDLSQAGGIHGLAAEQEDIRARCVAADEAIAMVDRGEVRNALSLIALHWFARRRAHRG